MYSSEYTSGFSGPAALHLVAPPSPRHEGNVGQAPSIFDQKDGGMSSLIVRVAEASRFIHVSILCKGGSVLVVLVWVIVSIIMIEQLFSSTVRQALVRDSRPTLTL